MMDQEQRYRLQQTEIGQVGIQASEELVKQYQKMFGVKLKSGRLEQLVNERTKETRYNER